MTKPVIKLGRDIVIGDRLMLENGCILAVERISKGERRGFRTFRTFPFNGNMQIKNRQKYEVYPI